MATLEEKVSELSNSLQANLGRMEEWRQKVDIYMNTTEARVATSETNVQWLIHQYEQLSSKDKNGHKGLKKAFGSKGSDLKPE
eukprot:1970829-Karenia_brevis.AAC.1